MGRHRTPQVQRLFLLSLWLLGFVWASALGLAGQQPGDSIQSTPESSQSQQQGQPSSAAEATSTFIGYATNGSFVFPDIATSAGPLTNGGKFKLFVNQSISPAYILVSASGAAINQARNVPEGYGQGWGAYGSRFGANVAS